MATLLSVRNNVHGAVPAARWHQKPHTKIWNGRRFGNAAAPKIDDMSIVHGNKALHLGLIVQTTPQQ
jgi:hypothetical protein